MKRIRTNAISCTGKLNFAKVFQIVVSAVCTKRIYFDITLSLLESAENHLNSFGPDQDRNNVGTDLAQRL